MSGPEELLEACAHLAGRLVGEGHREDAVGRHAVGGDEVGDAVGDDARLAAARAGEHQEGAVDGRDRPRLRLVQLGRRSDLPGSARSRRTPRVVASAVSQRFELRGDCSTPSVRLRTARRSRVSLDRRSSGTRDACFVHRSRSGDGDDGLTA